jgi:parallel beta-helix repeat protein
MKTTKKEWNKMFLFGIPAKVLVLGMVLVGFATIGGAAEPPSADASALVAALGGKAKASGSTVIPNKATVTGAVTVPAGVTLDLVKGVLTLGDGAHLTINGTVNVKSRDIGEGKPTPSNLKILAPGSSTIDGTGTLNLKSDGCVINLPKNGKLAIVGDVRLVGFEGNTRPMLKTNGELTLAGNVKVTGNQGYRGAEVFEGGTLTLSENAEITNNTVPGNGGGIHVHDNATFIMTGGRITGNTAGTNLSPSYAGAGGGGVYLLQKAKFVKTGGVISGNKLANGKTDQGLSILINIVDIGDKTRRHIEADVTDNVDYDGTSGTPTGSLYSDQYK